MSQTGKSLMPKYKSIHAFTFYHETEKNRTRKTKYAKCSKRFETISCMTRPNFLSFTCHSHIPPSMYQNYLYIPSVLRTFI